MNSGIPIDVGAALEKNTYLTSVADLERRGKRQVKVIKTSLIYDLITKAVDNVRQTMESSLDFMERERLVEESKIEFDRLLGEHQSQQGRLKELEDRIEDLNSRLAESEGNLQDERNRIQEVLEERDRALQEKLPGEEEGSDGLGSEEKARYEARIEELQEKLLVNEDVAKSLEIEENRRRDLESENAGYQARINELTEKLAEQEKNGTARVENEIENLSSQIQDFEQALEVTRQAAQEKDKALVEERERSEKEEATRSETAGHLHDMIRRQEAELEEAEKARKENEDYRLQVASLTAELKAVRENQPATDGLLDELKEMREDFKAMESRNRELEVLAAAAENPAPDTSALEEIFEQKVAKITSEISAKLEGLKHGSDVGTSPEDIKLTIAKIFSEEIDTNVTNIGDIKVKEKKTGGISDNLKRLKNLGKSSGEK